MKTFACLFVLALAAAAQMPVAPSGAAAGSPRGEDIGGYNITNAWELGYRFRDVNGNLGKYRSDVNYGNGVRLLSSRLSVHSKEGHGGYFDELLLNTQGLGNDPYQYSSLRIQKNRLYRYDLIWRQNEYFNPALPIAAGQHLLDTTRRMQDHDIVLLPQAPFRLHAGFSRWAQGGPGLSTVQLFDVRGDEFPLDTDIRRSINEYRLGFDATLAGVKLTVMRGWEYFKEDTRRTGTGLPGNNVTDLTQLGSFRRDEPYRGDTRTWRLHLLADRSKSYGVNARYTWAGGRRNFLFDESAAGADRFGGARNRQVLVAGDGRRPVSAGSLTASFYPSNAITVVNHTSFHNTRLEGEGTYRELANGSLSFSEIVFNELSLRTIATATEANYRPTGLFTVFAGHQFSTRRIRSVEQSVFSGQTDRLASEQDNVLHAGRAGIRLRGWRRLSAVFDGEIGRADRPVYPVSERNYHALSGRVQYKSRPLTATALVRTQYNTNSVSLFAHSARSRNYSADVSWTPAGWAGIDANYNKLHLDTVSGIAYFFSGRLERDRSVYLSNIHAATLGLRLSPPGRASLFLGYSRVQDTGGDAGRGLPQRPEIGLQVYPLSFESPLGRLTLRLRPNVALNAGYQFYRYTEQRLRVQNYGAHTGFSSVTWSF